MKPEAEYVRHLFWCLDIRVVLKRVVMPLMLGFVDAMERPDDGQRDWICRLMLWYKFHLPYLSIVVGWVASMELKHKLPFHFCAVVLVTLSSLLW
jgi:cytochrome bd-type quinol oxidase subunit 1